MYFISIYGLIVLVLIIFVNDIMIIYIIGCPCLPRNNSTLEWIGDKYWIYINWYKKYFGEDTQFWFLLLVLR